MALWRLIWVNAAHTQEIGRFVYNFPTAGSNKIANGNTYSSGDANSVCNKMVNDGPFTTATPDGFIYTRDPGTTWDPIYDAGFTSYFNSNYLEVGQRFYIGRWDANHSYIEVTSRNGVNTQLQYKCYDGTVYATANINFVNYVASISFGCFPWCTDTNYENWDSNDDANLISYTLTYYITGTAGAGCAWSQLSTNGYEIGKKFWGAAETLDENPYADGGYSEPGGGDFQKQNWSENSDIVLPSPMPSETDYGAVACGLITIFTPSKQQLTKLSEVLWGQGFWNFVQNAIQNISDLFVSLAMVPFTVTEGATVEVTWFSFDVGGQVPIGTGIYLTKASNQWYEFDMGTINLTGRGDGFAADSVLDYSPFSKLGIYLPFIGYQELDIDECRESPINLLYRIDILSGTCVALITINGRTIYQFTGNCLTQLPLTSMDAQTMLSNAVNIGIAAASAGATAAVASAGDAMVAENLASGKISAGQAELQNAQHLASVSNAQGSLTSATANGILGMKPNFKKSGAVSASASLFNVMQPYLFLTTPRQSMPEGYEKVCGFPCNMGGTLGEFSGFTVVEDIRLNGLVATSPEVEEIYQLLKQGVII